MPRSAIRLADTDAVNCEVLTNTVGSAAPFHCTVSVERIPVPLTVSVKAAPPAVAELGLNPLIAGGSVTVRVTGTIKGLFDAPTTERIIDAE
jgi:hypothetical protein